MKEIKISVSDVQFGYEQNENILNGLSFQVNEGESVGLIGENGTGKSTLLKLLTGLHLNYEGRIEAAGMTVEKKNLGSIRQHLGYVFQDSDSQLFMSTVYEDVAFGPRNYGMDQAETNRRTEMALEQIHIRHLRDRQIHKLSGGEKKMVSIATILSLMPDIILLDEPSIALDPKNRRHLIRLLNQMNQMKVIASHDLDMIWDTCERTVLLYKGKIAADGRTEDILRDKELLESCGLELPLRFYMD